MCVMPNVCLSVAVFSGNIIVKQLRKFVNRYMSTHSMWRMLNCMPIMVSSINADFTY